jgi:hypothetical protein
VDVPRHGVWTFHVTSARRDPLASRPLCSGGLSGETAGTVIYRLQGPRPVRSIVETRRLHAWPM